MTRYPLVAHSYQNRTIYIPTEDDDGGKKCPNDIDEVCLLLDNTIKTTLQNTLNHLKDDAEDIATRIDKTLSDDESASEHNTSARIRGVIYTIVGLLLPLLFIVVKIVRCQGTVFSKSVPINGISYLRA